MAAAWDMDWALTNSIIHMVYSGLTGCYLPSILHSRPVSGPSRSLEKFLESKSFKVCTKITKRRSVRTRYVLLQSNTYLSEKFTQKLLNTGVTDSPDVTDSLTQTLK